MSRFSAFNFTKGAADQIGETVRKSLNIPSPPNPTSGFDLGDSISLGKTKAEHKKGEYGVIELWVYSGDLDPREAKGTEAYSGIDLANVYNRFADLPAETECLVATVGRGIEIIAADPCG